MSRNNMERTGAPPADAPIQQQAETKFNPLSFVAPTELVDLPSKGKGYPTNHPLHNKETVEIRFMTAKEEDILASQSLIKKGIVIERFMESILIDKTIKPGEMLIGDRNAVIIAARVSGYGAEYETTITCPACQAKSKFAFDLNDKKVHETEVSEDLNLTHVEDGLFSTKMPFSNFNVKFKLLKGKDELYLTKLMNNKRKGRLQESIFTDQMKQLIVEIEGHSDKAIINQYVDNMPTLDSRHLRTCYSLANPDVKVTNIFTCPSCGFEEGMEVPFGADFFWPDS